MLCAHLYSEINILLVNKNDVTSISARRYINSHIEIAPVQDHVVEAIQAKSMQKTTNTKKMAGTMVEELHQMIQGEPSLNFPRDSILTVALSGSNYQRYGKLLVEVLISM